MIFTKLHKTRLIIDGEINEKHALLVECGPGHTQKHVKIIFIVEMFRSVILFARATYF